MCLFEQVDKILKIKGKKEAYTAFWKKSYFAL